MTRRLDIIWAETFREYQIVERGTYRVLATAATYEDAVEKRRTLYEARRSRRSRPTTPRT